MSSFGSILAAAVRVNATLLGVCLLGLAAPPARADTFSITTNNDYGPGSLRQAIEDANALAGADEIRFAVTGDIVLASDLPDITDDLVIHGPGSDTVTIDGDSQVRMFRIATGVVVDVTDVTLADGTADGLVEDSYGGCISNAGTLALRNVAMHECEAVLGGGIYNGPDAVLTLTDSLLEHGHATEDGAGIYNAPGAELTLVGSTIAHGDTYVDGGGIYSYQASVVLTDSTITQTTAYSDGGGIYSYEGSVILTDSAIENTRADSVGGAIAIDGPSDSNMAIGTLLVERSTLSDNTAEYGGGAVYNYGQRVVIRNSTLAGNETDAFGGGGVYTELESSEVWVINSTLSDNSADYGGGAVQNSEVFPSLVVLIHSTLEGNSGHDAAVEGSFASKNSIFDNEGPNCFELVNETISDIGVNLSSDDSCGSFTQVTSAELGLGPLADNGGATPTHALLPGSVAIDAAPDCTDLDGEPIDTDQRGIARPADGDRDGTATCDVGAFELGNEVLFANGFD